MPVGCLLEQQQRLLTDSGADHAALAVLCCVAGKDGTSSTAGSQRIHRHDTYYRADKGQEAWIGRQQQQRAVTLLKHCASLLATVGCAPVPLFMIQPC